MIFEEHSGKIMGAAMAAPDEFGPGLDEKLPLQWKRVGREAEG